MSFGGFNEKICYKEFYSEFRFSFLQQKNYFSRNSLIHADLEHLYRGSLRLQLYIIEVKIIIFFVNEVI